MHDCASILDSIVKRGLPCFYDFSHGTPHPYIPIHSFLHLFHIIFLKRIVTYRLTRACASTTPELRIHNSVHYTKRGNTCIGMV